MRQATLHCSRLSSPIWRPAPRHDHSLTVAAPIGAARVIKRVRDQCARPFSSALVADPGHANRPQTTMACPGLSYRPAECAEGHRAPRRAIFRNARRGGISEVGQDIVVRGLLAWPGSVTKADEKLDRSGILEEGGSAEAVKTVVQLRPLVCLARNAAMNQSM